MVCQACGEWAASAPLCGDCLQRVNDESRERYPELAEAEEVIHADLW
jgi:hypothetical protein